MRILVQARPGQDIRSELNGVDSWSTMCVRDVCVRKPYFNHTSKTPSGVISSISRSAVCLKHHLFLNGLNTAG